MFDEWPELFRRRRLDEEPAVAAFASGLAHEGVGAIDIDRSILSRYLMLALPLVEWDFAYNFADLFETLRQAGASKGYFVHYPGDWPHDGHFLECDLTSETANVIAGKGALFGEASVFVDNRFLSAVAFWHSEFTYFCMSAALFDAHLAAHPMELELDWQTSPTQASDFQTALKGAIQRMEDWSTRTLPVREALDWQRARDA